MTKKVILLKKTIVFLCVTSPKINCVLFSEFFKRVILSHNFDTVLAFVYIYFRISDFTKWVNVAIMNTLFQKKFPPSVVKPTVW